MKLTDHRARSAGLNPSITYHSAHLGQESVSLGEYDLAESELLAFSNEKRVTDFDEEFQMDDRLPEQLPYHPFKYQYFIIPIYKFPIVDALTIFIPLFLLSVISLYIFFQDPELNDRILNVASLMIAYTAIQPIIRESLPKTPNLTLMNILVYSQLLVNMISLIYSLGDIRFEDPDTYSFRPFENAVFIVCFVIAVINLVIVAVLMIYHTIKQEYFNMDNSHIYPFEVNDDIQCWRLSIMKKRLFARYSFKSMELEFLPADSKAKHR